MPNAFDHFASVFDGLPIELRAMIREKAVLMRTRRGGDVVSHGDVSNQVYLLLQGQVQIRLLTKDGGEAILRDLHSGDLLGELAAIDGGPRSAWAVAVADSVLARLPGETFRRAVVEIPAIAEWMQVRLVGQVRDLTRRWFELNALQVRSRLHCELARMCAHSTSPVTFDPAPTHAELAARIGTHREAITREMGYLARSGVVEQLSQRRLTVHDPAALQRLADLATGGMEVHAPPQGSALV